MSSIAALLVPLCDGRCRTRAGVRTKTQQEKRRATGIDRCHLPIAPRRENAARRRRPRLGRTGYSSCCEPEEPRRIQHVNTAAGPLGGYEVGRLEPAGRTARDLAGLSGKGGEG